MLIEELVSYYQKTAGAAVSEVPKGSILGGTADEILDMVTCYASDAAVFLKHEDLVNAFAASEYGLGWLDCGIYLGYTKAVFTNCLELAKEFPKELFEKLEEKTLRYQRMLTGALDGSVPAPDAETGCYATAATLKAEKSMHQIRYNEFGSQWGFQLCLGCALLGFLFNFFLLFSDMHLPPKTVRLYDVYSIQHYSYHYSTIHAKTKALFLK